LLLFALSICEKDTPPVQNCSGAKKDIAPSEPIVVLNSNQLVNHADVYQAQGGLRVRLHPTPHHHTLQEESDAR
jgi:hypothetical protein